MANMLWVGMSYAKHKNNIKAVWLWKTFLNLKLDTLPGFHFVWQNLKQMLMFLSLQVWWKIQISRMRILIKLLFMLTQITCSLSTLLIDPGGYDCNHNKNSSCPNDAHWYLEINFRFFGILFCLASIFL